MSELAIRQFKFKIRDMNPDTGIIVGYASTFNEPVPYYNEVMMKGAFAKTIKESGGKVPILRGHCEHIGRGVGAVEDNKGLLVEGQLLINDVQDAREEFALMKQSLEMGAVHGISVGMRIIKEEMKDFKGVPLSHISEVDLREWSPTPFQAYPTAHVTDVRDLRKLINISRLTTEEKALVERLLRDHGAADIITKPSNGHSDSDMALLIETCGKVRQAAKEFNEPILDHSLDGVRESLANLNKEIEVTR